MATCLLRGHDALIHQLGKQGLRVKFVPSLMKINRRIVASWRVPIGSAGSFLTARLYHPFWPMVLLHGFGNGTESCFIALAWTMIAASRATGRQHCGAEAG